MKNGIPTNPFPEGNPTARTECLIGSTVLTLNSDGATAEGWRYNPTTGVIIANDDGATGGINHDTL
jgi:hypothetical protein